MAIGKAVQLRAIGKQHRAGRMLEAISGQKQLEAKLRHLGGKGAVRAVAAGTRASLTPIARALRAAITASDASTNLKREARKTIGFRFQRGGTSRIGKTTTPVAKAGFSVGKKAGGEVKKFQAKAGRKASAGKAQRGVGISSNNIHWYVLGTNERFQKSTGKSVGEITNIFGDVTRRALDTSTAPSLAAARLKISQVIRRESLKRS